MCLRSIPVDSFYQSYQRLAAKLPLPLRWLAFILAPFSLSLSVFVAGLFTVASGLTITLAIGHVAKDGNTAIGVVVLLVIAFIVESVGHIIKERQESLLTAVVSQLAYRRFRSVFTKKMPTLEARGNVLTHPDQISQFAYVVDGAVSMVQIIAFLAISLWIYGVGGAIAVLIILGLIFISVRLIKLIGQLWESYITCEAERRSWVQRVACALPRGRAVPTWNSALDRIENIRKQEEHLLRKRVRLQVLNGFIDRSALTVTLSVVAILGVWLWPNTGFGIGIILAARYLYAAVQNNLVNYRVIRLAVPMMRELDSLEAQDDTEKVSVDVQNRPPYPVEVLDSDSARAQLLRSSLNRTGSVYVPQNPELPQTVLTAWKCNTTEQELSRFASFAAAMELSGEVVERFWRDAQTLSSGERHRAAVALVLAEEPAWIILDDTFAALDPTTRDTVAHVIIANVALVTIISSSEEYVPAELLTRFDSDSTASVLQSYTAENNSDVTQKNQQQLNLPDPAPKQATFRRSVSLLFGLHIFWVILGAVLIAGSEVGFAVVVAKGDSLSSQVTYAATVCAIGATLGALLYYITIYRVPINRLSALHKTIIRRIDKFASPQTSGAVVGRVGEDFSDLQMSVPSAIGSVFIVITQALMLIAGAVAGAPLYIIVVIIVAPLTLLAMKLGTKKIMPAATQAANQRGEFLGAVGVQAALHQAPVSAGLRTAGEKAYGKAEGGFLSALTRQADAYAYRSLLVQTLILVLNISAVVFASMFATGSALVEPAAVIFFAVTLSSSIQSTVETLQEVGVLGLTTERVRLLADFETARSQPPVRADILTRLQERLATGDKLIAVIGKTGAGKSVVLDALYHQRQAGEVAIIPDADPFDTQDTKTSGLMLTRYEALNGTSRLLLLDETMKNLTPAQERDELYALAKTISANGKQAVVVLHSRSNLDCFASVIDLDK